MFTHCLSSRAGLAQLSTIVNQELASLFEAQRSARANLTVHARPPPTSQLFLPDGPFAWTTCCNGWRCQVKERKPKLTAPSTALRGTHGRSPSAAASGTNLRSFLPSLPQHRFVIIFAMSPQVRLCRDKSRCTSSCPTPAERRGLRA